ncbi:MAG: nuclear transport factor 2 family protein [Bacteroidota bacterium]
MKTIFSVVLLGLLLFGCSRTKQKQQHMLETENHRKTEIAEQNKNTVLVFFKSLENEDVEAVVDLFAEDGRHHNPYASGIFPEGASGKKEIRNYWAPVFPNFDGMEFPIEEIHAMEDPAMVFVKYQGKITLKNNAGINKNMYYSTFKFDSEGHITEYVEIFNPITAARGFGMLDKIK